MRDSILNVRSSGLGGVVHEVKRGARKVDKVNANISRHIEKKKKEKYIAKREQQKLDTKKAKEAIKTANKSFNKIGKSMEQVKKNAESQNREIEKGRLRRAKIRDKEVATRMKVLNSPRPEPKEKHGYKRNDWGDITYY